MNKPWTSPAPPPSTAAGTNAGSGHERPKQPRVEGAGFHLAADAQLGGAEYAPRHPWERHLQYTRKRDDAVYLTAAYPQDACSDHALRKALQSDMSSLGRVESVTVAGGVTPRGQSSRQPWHKTLPSPALVADSADRLAGGLKRDWRAVQGQHSHKHPAVAQPQGHQAAKRYAIPTKHKVFVGGLSDVGDAELTAYFTQFGAGDGRHRHAKEWPAARLWVCDVQLSGGVSAGAGAGA